MNDRLRPFFSRACLVTLLLWLCASGAYAQIPPSITGQPASQTICVNTGAILSVTATGATSYQWQTDSATGTFSDISDDAVYSNVTTATLTLNNIPATYNGYKYRCNVTNTAGTVASDSAVLIVVDGIPMIIAQPSDATGCPGGTFGFSSSATTTAGMLAYQWQVDTGSGFNNVINGSVYSNATTATLQISGASAAMFNYSYRFKATNACGDAYSNSAHLLFPVSTGTRDFTGSGNWNNPANWTPCGYPVATETVTIGPGDSIVIPAGYSATAKNITISGGLLTIASTGSLTLNNASAEGIDLQAGGRCINNGNLTINNTGLGGIRLTNASWNNTGKTEINNVIANGVWADNSSIVLNSGELFIGNRGTIGDRGIFCTNGSTLTNTTTGIIRSDSVMNNNGLEVQSNAVFTNNGTIYTGYTASLNEDGLFMYQGNFINNGVLNIANTRRAGIQFYESSLINRGQLNIKNVAATGIISAGNATMMNDTGGTIAIAHILAGSAMANYCSFTNKGLIKLGEDDAILTGIYHGSGSFSNESTGVLEIDSVSGFASLRSIAPFVNTGIIRIGSRSAAGDKGLTVEYGGSFINSGQVDVRNCHYSGISVSDGCQYKNEANGVTSVSRIIEGSALDNYGTLSNSATIRIGRAGSLLFDGIYNAPPGTL